MKKIGISTVYTGFNYGSCLQAYASQKFISNLGYDSILISYKGGFIKGRDIRFNKLAVMISRTIFRPKLFKKTFLTYKNSLKKEMNIDTKNQFLEFQSEHLNVMKLNWGGMKKFAEDRNTLACVCGSDQIWNSTNVYIDPAFYLRYAPKEKRIAYAPSLGKSYIPKYNRFILKKYIEDFNHISVREEQGVELLKELTGKKAISVLDPTLLLNKNEWIEYLNIKNYTEKKYILAYFLDKPSEIAIKCLKELSQKTNMPIFSIPYRSNDYYQLNNINYIDAGPLKFLELVNNSAFVFTDSFHGMAFSINFNIPFYIFQRNYGTAVDQSSRIISLLNKLEISDRFISKNKKFEYKMDFNKINILLNKERKKSTQYLLNLFSMVDKKRGYNEK